MSNAKLQFQFTIFSVQLNLCAQVCTKMEHGLLISAEGVKHPLGHGGNFSNRNNAKSIDKRSMGLTISQKTIIEL